MITAAIVLLALALGVPLFVIIGLAAAVAFALYGGHAGLDGLQILIVKMTSLTTKNVFLAIPFFVVSGAIMGEGSIARRLVALAQAAVGGVRGGLAVAALLASVVFAALSGSSPVTLIAIGGVMFPAMRRAGYGDAFSLGLVTTAGSLGCLVPPSIPMLIYAISVTGTSAVDVRDLFLAGLFAAVVVVFLLATYAVVVGGRGQVSVKRFSFADLQTAFREGAWALCLPVVILGGIYGGVFTPTEASAVSVVCAAFIEVVVHRSMSLRQLADVAVKAVANMGGLLVVIALSLAVNDFMIEAEIAEKTLSHIRAFGLGPVGFLMVVNIFLVVTGMFMDSISAIVLFTPIVAPAAVALGIDPLHLGIVFIVNMEIGYLAPPIATNLFVAATIFKKPFVYVTRATLPTLAILCVGLLIVTYVPTLTVGPVHAMRGGALMRPLAATKDALVDQDAEKQPPGAVDAIQSTQGAGASNVPSGSTGAATTTPGKVLTIEEMMRIARERRMKADAGSP